jgi:hypothetical protein
MEAEKGISLIDKIFSSVAYQKKEGIIQGFLCATI